MNKKHKFSRRLLALNTFAGIMLVGIILSSIGPALPQTIAEYQISLTAAGVVFTALGIGRFASVVVGGRLADIFGRKPILLGGGSLITVGIFSYAAGPSWWVQLGAIFVAGIGLGCFDIGLNTLTVDLYPETRGSALNRLHAFFGIGSLLGPVMAGQVIEHLGWRWVFYIISVVAFAFCVFCALLRFPAPSGTGETQEEGDGRRKDDGYGRDSLWRRIVSTWSFWLLAGLLLMYTGMNWSVSGWLVNYLRELLAFSVMAASLGLFLYNVGLTVGRFGSSLVAERLGYKYTMQLGAFCSLVAITVAIATRYTPAVYAGFTLAGFFSGTIFPTAVAYGSQLFPEHVGTVSGMLITFSAVGGVFIPWSVGAVSDLAGLQAGMIVVAFLFLIMLVISIVLRDDRQ